ncbi:uncharacterized protein ARMOST_17005 [Armillaria ostoyae]|uniref:Uncharacterized protein n=1 Tax=Armillaria ostoyae TaxID=47428 RepID=A0A284RXT9_ARMOS|nr:uncharacterized protein ARMOST_17005 [Armillaria ostoyae]
MGMLKSLKLMHNGSASTPPNSLEWKKATAFHTIHTHMYTALPNQCSRFVKDLVLEGCTGPDRPAGGGGLSCILPFFNVERLVLVPIATTRIRGTTYRSGQAHLPHAMYFHLFPDFIRITSTRAIPPPPPFICSDVLGNIHWQCRRSQTYRPIPEILAPLRELRHLTIHVPTVTLLSVYSEAFLLNFHDVYLLPSLVTVDLQLHRASTVERSTIDEIVKERTLRNLNVGEAFPLRGRVMPYSHLWNLGVSGYRGSTVAADGCPTIGYMTVDRLHKSSNLSTSKPPRLKYE